MENLKEELNKYWAKECLTEKSESSSYKKKEIKEMQNKIKEDKIDNIEKLNVLLEKISQEELKYTIIETQEEIDKLTKKIKLYKAIYNQRIE